MAAGMWVTGILQSDSPGISGGTRQARGRALRLLTAGPPHRLFGTSGPCLNRRAGVLLGGCSSVQRSG